MGKLISRLSGPSGGVLTGKYLRDSPYAKKDGSSNQHDPIVELSRAQLGFWGFGVAFIRGFRAFVLGFHKRIS